MSRRFSPWLFVGSLASWAAPSQSFAQTCQIDRYSQLVPPGLVSNTQYGAAIAVSGDWIFVGAPYDGEAGMQAGAVHAFKMIDSEPQFMQKLLPVGGIGIGQFGSAICVEGDILLIGAPRDATSTGAAYVFRFDGQSWTQQARLTPIEFFNGARFGSAVLVKGGRVFVGAYQNSTQNISSAGAVYVFSFDGRQWNSDQVLRAPTPIAGGRFGRSIAFAQNSLVIGETGNNTVATGAGAIHVFQQSGNVWAPVSVLYAPDGQANDNFGMTLAADGTRIVVAAPFATAPVFGAGAAYIFQFADKGGWQFEQKLLGAGDVQASVFGTSVAILSDRIAVGAPKRDLTIETGVGPPQTFVDAGVADVFHFSNGTWSWNHQLRSYWDNQIAGPPYECWINGVPPALQELSNDQLGSAVAITPDAVLTGAIFGSTLCGGSDNTGSVNVYRMGSFDCNDNDIWDQCETDFDCNHNNYPDDCDFASGVSVDCNQNGIPDECDAGFSYALDQGQPSLALGITGGADLIWMNQFMVKPGGEVITHIAFIRNEFVPIGMPATVLLYRDKNNDGDPSDAELLASATTFATHDDGYPYDYSVVPIQPTFVGPPGQRFFIGCFVQLHPGSNWALMNVDASGLNPTIQRSWFCHSPYGMGNLKNLSDNELPPTHWPPSSGWPGQFMLRAVANDCNANGVWDACDIANGTSKDVNGNGIPDECETPWCYADVSPVGGDGEVNVSDLLQVINHWGGCTPCFAICEGDTNDDCAVNVTDLLAVITQWGACP